MSERGPICAACGVLYVAEYEGPCQEESGCSGRVSWEATADRLAARLGTLERAILDVALTPDSDSGVRLAKAQRALAAAGGQ